MIKKFSLFALLLVTTMGIAFSQNLTPTYLNAATNGTTITLPQQGILLLDDNAGANGNYSPNCNYTYTVTGTCPSPNKLGVRVDLFDIDPTDTLFIYDGPTTAYRLLAASNNEHDNIAFRTFFVTSTNTTNSLTVRFKSNNDNRVGAGFALTFMCSYPCEQATPIIENTFYKTRNGNITDTCEMRQIIEHDTIRTSSGTTITTNVYNTANICHGECIKLKAHGEYSNFNGVYTPSDRTSTFKWAFGNNDTLSGVGATLTPEICYDSATCYFVTLGIVDNMGCGSGVNASMYVRIAPNPIRTISPLDVICANDSILVSVGFDEFSTVRLEEINIENSHTRVNNSKTFIPDGPNCDVPCYSSPVVFNEFSDDQTITSKEDICSICVNYEHEFMGDYKLSIVCPSNRRAVLKYKENETGNLPTGSYGGSGTYTGYPYGGSDHHTYDGGTGEYCDSIYNMYGVGLDYCFSRNSSYTLVDGVIASTTTTTQTHYLGYTGAYIDNVTYTFPNIPRPFDGAGHGPGTCTFETKHPSNHEAKSDYYLPADDFSTLVGCPLNGTWKIEICDYWGADNGWVFNWSMDLCNAYTDNYNCKYQVPIDSLFWTPDSTQGDWLTGEYRGLHVFPTGNEDFSAYISTVDTGGTFNVYLNAVDDFGCHWDTIVPFTSIPLPRTVQPVNKCPYDPFTWVDGNTYYEPQTPRPTWIFPAVTGCDSIVSLQIINDQIPNARISVLPEYVSYDHPEVTVYDISEGDRYRDWYFDDETGHDAIQTFTYPVLYDSLTIMMVAYSQYGCIDTAYATIPMDKTLLWVPTAFTPNEEDNSLFFIKGHDILDDVQVYVYNRMGALVSSWTGFNGSWNGQHKGKRCPTGSYSWVVKYHSTFEPDRWRYETGTVTLLR